MLSALLLALAIDPGLATCEARFAAAPDSEEAAECFATVGRNQGLIPQATARLEALLAAHPDHPWLLLYLGNLRWAEPAKAEKPYRRAAAVFAARGDPAGAVRAHTALHGVLTKLGRFEEALREIDRVDAMARRAQDPWRETRVAILRAKHLRLVGGDLQRAYSLLHSAGTALGPESPYPLQRDALEELANVCYAIGRRTEARETYQRFAALAATRGELRTEANARYGVLRILIEELKETPRPDLRVAAAAEARELLAVASTVGHRELSGRAHLILGHLSGGAEARAHLDRCLADMVTGTDRIACLDALAQLQRREGRPEEALATIGSAFALSREVQDPWTRADILRERMRVLWETAPREQALASSRMALDWIEAIRGQQSGDASRAGLHSVWADDYYWLSGRLLEDHGEPGNVAESFGVIERLRARALLETLEAAHAAQKPPRTPTPSDTALLSEVQRTLAPDEALLSFQIGPDEGPWGDSGGGSWLLAITREEVAVHRLRRDRVALRPAVRLFNGLFERRDGSEARPAAGLYADLLGDALRGLPKGIRRLVIVADDALHQLPFAALRPAAGELPLAYRFEVTAVPSATLWLRWRTRRPPAAADPLLALADPVPPGEISERPAVERAALPGGLDPLRLGPLPFARREGKAAVRHLAGNSLLRLGNEASEGFFKGADLRRFGVLHFATHAVLDDEHPERSGVLLTPAPVSEDGLLQIREIVPLHMDGRIVVLSSCRSASGTVLRGEGVLGLARAFFQAGAHTVVASLWPLRDDDGAALFDRFYHHLGQGMSVAAALHAAQRERAEEGAPAYAWAGLVVLGDGGIVPLPGGRKQPPFLAKPLPTLAAGLVLMAFLTVLWYRRRRGVTVAP